MDELLFRFILETLGWFIDAWQSGRVSHGWLVGSLAMSMGVPIVAMTATTPVLKALLWGCSALAWIVYLALLVIGCSDHKKALGGKPPRAQFDHSASDD